MPTTLPQTAQGARLPQNYRPPGTNTISQSPNIPGQPWRKNAAGNLSGSNITGNSYGSPTAGDLNLPRSNPTYRPPPGPPPATYGGKGIPANSYNHPQAAAFQPPQAPRGRFDPPPPYGSAPRPNLPRPAISPRPAAVPRPRANIPRGIGGKAISGGAGAVASGAITAGAVLASGGSVQEAIGAGVGAGVGSAIGGAAGAAAGAALGPVGAVVGGVVGSMVGGAIGGAIGQGIGDLVDGPDIPTEAIAPGEITQTLPPAFTGGQSFVDYEVTGVRLRCSSSGVVEGQDELTQTVAGRIIGGGTSTGPGLNGCSPGSKNWGVWRENSNGQQNYVSYGFTGSSAWYAGFKITNIVRSDGLPDTGGDPPGETVQAAAPRPAVSVTPSPPELAPPPVPAPLFTPIPALPPAPTGDKPPSLEPTPTPDQAPAITPDNAPAITPVPLPMPAPKQGPISTSGTATAPRTEIGDPTKNQTTPPPGKPKQYPTNPGGCGCNAPIIKNQQAILAGQQAATQTQQVDLSDVKARLTRIEGNQTNPVTGFAALQTGQVGLLGYMTTLNNFLRLAWEKTRIQKVLDVLTFVAVMHNVAMLSRDVAETFGWVAGQALNVVGIEDEEGNSIDVYGWFTSSVQSLLVAMFGQELYDDAREVWLKASAITRAANAIIWTVRGIMDASLDLMEWVAENTGKIGNALKRYGVVGDGAYKWMSERAQARNRVRARFDKVTGGLENAEDVASSFSMATGNVLEIQQETGELGQQFADFRDTVTDGIPDPWDDNAPVAQAVATESTVSQSPDIETTDTNRGN